jgi:zinc-ribbon domain
MNNEAEKTCASCGKPLKEGVAFCTSCGAAVGAAGDAAAAVSAQAPPPGPLETVAPVEGTPPPPVPPAAGVEGAAVQPPVYAAGPAPKKNKAALIVGICGGILIVVAVVVILLGFAVGPKWFVDNGGGGTGDPVALAQKYMDSLEQGDIDAYMACFQEDFFINEIKSNPLMESLGLSEEDIKQYAGMAFDMMEVKFEGVELEVTSQQGDKATVVTTAGTASVSVFGMEEKLDLATDPLEFNMVKADGRWYLAENPMGGSMGTDMGSGLEDLQNLDSQDLQDFNLQDFNLQDLEQYLPEGMSLDELMNMTPEELDQMLKELEQLMQDLPQQDQSTSST